MHTRVENEVHSNTTLIIRLSWQEKKGGKMCCADFLFFIPRGKRKSAGCRMEEEDGGVQTLCEAYNIANILHFHLRISAGELTPYIHYR